MMELAGRTVMVTGASGGIGEPLCAALIDWARSRSAR